MGHGHIVQRWLPLLPSMKGLYQKEGKKGKKIGSDVSRSIMLRFTSKRAQNEVSSAENRLHMLLGEKDCKRRGSTCFTSLPVKLTGGRVRYCDVCVFNSKSDR